MYLKIPNVTSRRLIIVNTVGLGSYLFYKTGGYTMLKKDNNSENTILKNDDIIIVRK